MLQQLLPFGAWAFMLVFARIGSIVMLLPGFAEAYVAVPVRLAIALAIVLAVAPGIVSTLPPLPDQPLALFAILGLEIAIGLFIGTLVRLLMSALQVAGTVIALQSGLGSATFFDPAQGEQSAIFANLLALMGVVAIFAADLHLMLLRATGDSYALFPPGGAVPFSGFAEVAGRFVAGSFLLGVQISAPFIVYGLVFNTGLGLLQRLMPALQMFMVIVPVQIVVAFALFALSVGAGMVWFLDHLEDSASALLQVR